MADVALAHDPLDDLQHRAGSGRAAPSPLPERPDRQRHRGVGPLRGAALGSVRFGLAGADMGEELFGRVRSRRLGERPPDIDSGVIVGAPDRGAPMGLDVDERRQVQLLRA